MNENISCAAVDTDFKVTVAASDFAVSVKATSRVMVPTIFILRIAAAQQSQLPKNGFSPAGNLVLLLSSSTQGNPPAAARWDSRGPFANAGSATTTA